MAYFTGYFTGYFDVAEGVAPVVPDQPTGGWAAYNYADIERRRRRKKELEELEDEADRLEVALIEAQTLPPNPIVFDRIKVREYAPQVQNFSRRTQRAVDYALRAKTALAYQLAARELAQAVEDEELAIVTLLAHIA